MKNLLCLSHFTDEKTQLWPSKWFHQGFPAADCSTEVGTKLSWGPIPPSSRPGKTKARVRSLNVMLLEVEIHEVLDIIYIMGIDDDWHLVLRVLTYYNQNFPIFLVFTWIPYTVLFCFALLLVHEI